MVDDDPARSAREIFRDANYGAIEEEETKWFEMSGLDVICGVMMMCHSEMSWWDAMMVCHDEMA